jgi:hypothetical protein
VSDGLCHVRASRRRKRGGAAVRVGTGRRTEHERPVCAARVGAVPLV